MEGSIKDMQNLIFGINRPSLLGMDGSLNETPYRPSAQSCGDGLKIALGSKALVGEIHYLQ